MGIFKGLMGHAIENATRKNCSSAQRSTHLCRIFPFPRISVFVNYVVSESLVKCVCHLSLHNWVKEYDVFCSGYNLVTLKFICVVRLHLVKLIVVFLYGCFVMSLRTLHWLSRECIACSLQFRIYNVIQVSEISLLCQFADNIKYMFLLPCLC